MTNAKIAVISGGNSPEASVSRSSAEGVIEALRKNYTSVISIELDNGIATALADFDPDVVFPILHGPPGEDGTLQGFLEILEYNYVGSTVHSSAFAMDKIVAKEFFKRDGLPIASQCVVSKSENIAAAVDRITRELGKSVVVKPACQGSSIGVSPVNTSDQLYKGLVSAFEFDSRILIEERIEGKEVTVGVLDTKFGTEAFPVIEVRTPENSWYDFDHRYTPGLSEHIMPAELSRKQSDTLQGIAISAHRTLGCRDLSRADFIVNESGVYLLEVNTLPGMTPTSLYPDGAKGYGLDFPKLVQHLVERALSRA